MSNAATRVTGLILLLVAAVWTIGSFWLIPPGFGGASITPRSFPVGLGLLLGALSILLIAGTFMGNTSLGNGASPVPAPRNPQRGSEYWALAVTFGFLVAYGVTLNLIGFVPATIVISAALLYAVLGTRSPSILVGLPLGLTFLIWFVMGKLMGVYLPRGALIAGV